MADPTEWALEAPLQTSVSVTVSLACDLEFSSTTAPATSVYGAISTARAGRATRNPANQRPAAIQTSRRRTAN